MPRNTRVPGERPRHFDRGSAQARWALAGSLLIAACSGSLKNDDPGAGGIVGGDAGTSGSAGVGGWAGVPATGNGLGGGDAGTGYGGVYGDGVGGRGGTSSLCTFPYTGPECPPTNCMAGTGNCGFVGGSGGSAGSAGSGGTGGSGGGGTGGMSLPICGGGAPTFGVCFMSDADVLPLPSVPNDRGVSTAGAATILEVGTGPAPAECESARSFGRRGTSEWWFQAKAADDHVWTIGVHGLGNTPLVNKADTVTLNLDWRGYTLGVGFGHPWGELQLSDGAATPLLWASADKNTTTWVTLAAGAASCAFNDLCDISRNDVVATVNGSQATVPSYGATSLGGYYLAVGQSVRTTPMGPSQCQDNFGPAFDAAAAKVPVSGP